MQYNSKKTEKGNMGVSFVSQELADLQAKEMDEKGCTNCTNCNECTNCTNCRNCNECINCHNCINCNECIDCYNCSECTECIYCRNCSECSKCRNCRNCTECSKCYNCINCFNCTNCTDCNGIIRWDGKAKARNLLALNGLTWSVATDGNFIQIGCQFHSVSDWKSFDDSRISKMDPKALTFWKQYKDIILALAKVRKEMETENGNDLEAT